MPVEGSLKELSLTNIIQLNCTEMNTARVSLKYQEREGVLCFAEGAIVHAETGDLVGEEAVYELLSWSGGSFVVETGVVPAERTVTTNWNMLLLDGMRRLDEQEPRVEQSPRGELAMPTSGTDDMTTLAHNLRKIAGVEGSVIISRDGIVLASDVDGDAEKEGAVAVFVGNAADQIGEALDLTSFDWGVVTMGNRDRVLILEGPFFFAGLLLSEKASPALVSAEAARGLG
jgi:predicted regulator of Ras-like GTPase activity (Roadblock/LC7/MglB family)